MQILDFRFVSYNIFHRKRFYRMQGNGERHLRIKNLNNI